MHASFASPLVGNFQYPCPFGHCKNSDFPFTLSNAAKTVWCSGCNKPFVGAKWSCPCNHIWYTCPLHPPRTRNTEPRLPGKRKVPRAFAPEEAEAKLLKIELRITSRALIWPKLSKKFPHLASEEVVCNIGTHSGTTAVADCSCIAVTDPADNNGARPAGSASSTSANLGPHIREGDDTNNVAELAEAVTPLATAVAAADASAAPVITKRKSKPFRIPNSEYRNGPNPFFPVFNYSTRPGHVVYRTLNVLPHENHIKIT